MIINIPLPLPLQAFSDSSFSTNTIYLMFKFNPPFYYHQSQLIERECVCKGEVLASSCLVLLLSIIISPLYKAIMPHISLWYTTSFMTQTRIELQFGHVSLLHTNNVTSVLSSKSILNAKDQLRKLVTLEEAMISGNFCRFVQSLGKVRLMRRH